MHHLGEIDWSEMEEADLRREFAPARRSLHPDPRDPAYDGPPEPDENQDACQAPRIWRNKSSKKIQKKA